MTDDLRTGLTIPSGRARFAGANIGTWIGFKQLILFVEDAVLEYLRARDHGPARLYLDYGLCVTIVASRLRLVQPVRLDDMIEAHVAPAPRMEPGELALSVRLFIVRGGDRSLAVTGSMKIAFERSKNGLPVRETPTELVPLVRTAPDSASSELPARGPRTFVWETRIPYFHCQFSEQLQYAAHLALIEEVVERFLADRGLSIRTMLEARSWIPVVSDVRTELRGRATMEETIQLHYTVEDVLKDVSYTARVDCYAIREGRAALVATSRITHGYARIDGHQAGLARLDAGTIATLMGPGKPPLAKESR